MQLLVRIGLIFDALGTMFTAIACAVDDWQKGNGGFKIGLWRQCTADNGCSFSTCNSLLNRPQSALPLPSSLSLCTR